MSSTQLFSAGEACLNAWSDNLGIRTAVDERDGAIRGRTTLQDADVGVRPVVMRPLQDTS
jgi:hypothetical protein